MQLNKFEVVENMPHSSFLSLSVSFVKRKSGRNISIVSFVPQDLLSRWIEFAEEMLTCET